MLWFINKNLADLSLAVTDFGENVLVDLYFSFLLWRTERAADICCICALIRQSGFEKYSIIPQRKMQIIIACLIYCQMAAGWRRAFHKLSQALPFIFTQYSNVEPTKWQAWYLFNILCSFLKSDNIFRLNSSRWHVGLEVSNCSKNNETQTQKPQEGWGQLYKISFINYYTVHIRPSSSNTILSQIPWFALGVQYITFTFQLFYFSICFVLILISCFKTRRGFHPSPVVFFF